MPSFDLRMQHTSLQFSDHVDQHEHDVKTLFGQGQAFPIKTGTEAGPGPGGTNNKELLVHYAEEYHHAINFAGDSWVAVDHAIITPKSLKKEDVFLVSNDMQQETRGSDRILATMSFEHVKPGVGTIHIGATHYPTKGAKPGDPNHDMNIICAEKISKWLAKVGHGADLAFVNGDFNMPDRTLDFALGGNFTSMADELKAWQSTGHGPIDGMCSYDRDGRVSAKHWNVLDDSELKMFSDHFACRGVWEIWLRKVAR